ncbi:MAG: hypothetical protein OXU45_06925, partial [Candidatus Melainabacteria bacterium]|nr:hypothetical protein [Candidatus Melainabacteria bacterium]
MQAVHLNQIASAYSDSNLATLRKSLIELDTKLDMDRLSYLFTYLRDKILETLDGFDELVRLSEQLGRIEDEE